MFSLGYPEEGNPPPQYGAGNYLGTVTCLKFCLLMPSIPTQNHKRESEVIYTAELQTQGTRGRSSNVALQLPAAWSPSALCFGFCIIPLCQHKHLCSCTENWIQEFIHVKTIFFFFSFGVFWVLFLWFFFLVVLIWISSQFSSMWSHINAFSA